MPLNDLFKQLKKRKIKLKRSIEKHQFDWLFNKNTIAMHDSVLAGAETSLANYIAHENIDICLNSPDPLVRQGTALKLALETEFKNCFLGAESERILIQIPDPSFSPAGYSLFSNLLESLAYIGVPAEALGWSEDVQVTLDRFKPTVFLSSDSVDYLRRIDWVAVNHYKSTHSLLVGLTASIEAYDNTPLLPRLDWAKQNGIDFFYSFRDADYVQNRQEYQPFFEAGYQILDLPFGANILHYYPVAGFNRDLDYVLMASRKREHILFLKNICRDHSGFLDGPGWKQVKNFRFNRSRDRYIYARAKVGLNIHLPEQIEWACELNERTYQLAACGVPQLIDHPKLLNKVFGHQSFFIAETPTQYETLFKDLMKHPEMGIEKALFAQKQVFLSHTTFHRAKSLLEQLKSLR